MSGLKPGEKMSDVRMPVLFIGHGSPINALEDNEYSRTWDALGKSLPRPKAIACISSHWETDGTQVTAMEHPRTIHDFDGFPRELFEKTYAAQGDPTLAITICSIVKPVTIRPDLQWGLDHGAWTVLCRMYPAADIPVVQISLDRTRDGQYHYNMGRSLRFLRDQGVLVIGTGNIVHNLNMMSWGGYPFEWAADFDKKVQQWIKTGDHDPLIHFEKQGKSVELAVNSGEHYLPLLYVLGMQEKGEAVEFFNESIVAGSISMRGVLVGKQ
jgi:4,5-DOPA dioxygenase extradiol